MNKIDMAAELFVRRSGEFVPLPDAEAEKMRQAALSAQDVDSAMRALEVQMVSRYLKAQRFTEMLDIINELHERPFMAPARVCLYLKQGSICETMSDYRLGIEYYSRGIQTYATMVDPDKRHIYWIFNNSAFCHCYERLFTDAQKLAEKAISIDQGRHNAWKNLGASFEYQGDYLEAAACYLASYIKCSGGEDPRPMMHLERLFKRHDGLKEKLAEQADTEMGKIFSAPYKDFCLGETYYHCGDLDKAESAYRRFFVAAPAGFKGCLAHSQKMIKNLSELKRIEAQFK